MKPFIALLVATLIAGLRPAEAAETPFAEYWVPQSDGQTIVSFYLGRRELKPGSFIARYKNLYRDQTGVTARTTTALVDCRARTISGDGQNVAIDLSDKQAAMATITLQNLWWRVCRGVQARYRPGGGD